MLIGIDATIVRSDRISGIERYVIELIHGLSRISSNNKYIIFCHKRGDKYFSDLANNFEVKHSPFISRILTEQLWLPFICNKSNIDLLHITSLAPSLLIKKRNLITVHDAVPWVRKKTISLGMKFYCKPLLTFFIKKKANLILTISKFSKSELCNTLKIDNKRVKYIYNGKSKKFTPSKSIDSKEKIKKLYNLKNDYILVLGTLEPRKNLNRLIKAFETIYKVTNLNLMISGRFGWKDDLIISDSIKKRIIITGYVDEKNLVELISCSKLFVFPSLYEGFGLPLIEAQSCGVPVVASKIDSFVEVGKDTVSYFNPYDVNNMASVIINTIKNPILLSKLSNSGMYNSTRFSWDKCARETSELYKHMCKNNNK